jgi:hypothetical protein
MSHVGPWPCQAHSSSVGAIDSLPSRPSHRRLAASQLVSRRATIWGRLWGVSGTRDWVTHFAHVPRRRLRPRLLLYFASLVTQSRVLGGGVRCGRAWAGRRSDLGLSMVAAMGSMSALQRERPVNPVRSRRSLVAALEAAQRSFESAGVRRVPAVGLRGLSSGKVRKADAQDRGWWSAPQRLRRQRDLAFTGPKRSS